jgi:hypothetical protein
MDQFQKSTFQAHPLVAPSIVMYLFEHRAPRAEVETLQSLVATQTKTLAEQAKEIKFLKTKMNTVLTQITELKKKK